MGSTESTLSPMEEQQQQQQPQQQERSAESRESIATPPASPPLRQVRPRRQRRATEPANTAAAAAAAATVVDDPWWWEIENENLILDQVPNVTAVYGESESENLNANTRADGLAKLRKVCDNVNATLGGQSPSGTGDCSDGKTETATTASAALQQADGYAAAIGGRSKIDEISERVVRDLAAVAHREQTLDEFKEELRMKRLARQNAVQEMRDEIATLRKQLAEEQALTRSLRGGGDSDGGGGGGVGGGADVVVSDSAAAVASVADVDATDDAKAPAAAGTDADDADPMSRGRHANIELANAQLALQLANSENLSLRTELGVVQKQVSTLKEVIACCKQMLSVKEEQCTQLKGKLQEIETSLGERELKIMSTNLRQEYERQLGNIRQLRQLYEERQRIALAEQENLQRLISIKRDELQAEQEKTKNFEEQNQTLLKEIESTNNELAALREECNEHKFEKKALKEEMGAVNTLFSQMVMGFNGKNNLDIDRLTMMLEENRTLLNDMATKEASCTDGATLPKLLFELVEQAAVSVKGSRSPTPMQFLTSTDDDDDDDEVVGEAAPAQSDANEADTAAASASATVATDTATAQSQETEADGVAIATAAAAVAVSEQGVSASEKDNVTVAAAKTGRRHRRKSAGNRMKLPTAAAAEAAASMLKFHEPEVMGKVASAQEIIGNLPKVWKVLMELLSHHKIEQVQFEENGASEDCYKSVETANGPKAELSVSKTYIKLKDLILEKKSLVKETNRLKTLNSHLEYRLNEQEKRLSAVSLELTKTWHLVGKMQRQHRQLHTQEQILRYQLQQKRRLLSELKDELEYCRRKWAAARAKNDESQEQCNDLRREFAQRKLDDANNSAESGYSDSGPPSDEEERAAGAAVAAAVCDGAAGVAAAAGGGGGNCRRRHLKEMFEHTRKIKRMQSTSPGRAGDAVGEVVLRWNSAPPTCGWGGGGEDGTVGGADVGDLQTMCGRGAIPKAAHNSRSEHRCRRASADEEGAALPEDGEERTERASRILRLEEQCKCLIQQVLETSDNRERLEVQLCRFQDEIAPAQYPVPLDEFINKKRIERMTRASSAPASAGTLTPREEEYTRKRSERLERLEEESRQLMSRIKRTSDRGHYLRCSLDRLRRAPSHEGSFESNTEEEDSKKEEVAEVAAAAVDADVGADVAVAVEITAEEQVLAPAQSEPAGSNVATASPLTAEEEAYTARRAARLQRLEAESKQLMTRLSRNAERGHTFENRLDTLHEQYGGDKPTSAAQDASAETSPASPTIEQRIGNIEKISSNREQRLRILEEEGKELLSRLSNTSERGTRMINRIAERELQRQARIQSDANTPPDAHDDNAQRMDDANKAATVQAPIAAAGALMPTLKNVACSSIVCDELTDSVIVTTTPSQIATQQGAVPKTPKPPKSQPTAQLNAAVRAQAAKKQTQSERTANGDGNNGGETLEDMVKRLRELPFPAEAANKKEEEEPSTEPKE